MRWPTDTRSPSQSPSSSARRYERYGSQDPARRFIHVANGDYYEAAQLDDYFDDWTVSPHADSSTRLFFCCFYDSSLTSTLLLLRLSFDFYHTFFLLLFFFFLRYSSSSSTLFLFLRLCFCFDDTPLILTMLSLFLRHSLCFCETPLFTMLFMLLWHSHFSYYNMNGFQSNRLATHHLSANANIICLTYLTGVLTSITRATVMLMQRIWQQTMSFLR